MTVGQIVDFCAEWNEIHGHDEEASGSDGNGEEEVIERKATQADWNELMG